LTQQYSTQALASILAAWCDDVAETTFEPHVTSSGLSGAVIWRVTHASQTFCLRRWPREHPGPEKLSDVHHLLRHVQQQGIDFVPVPLVTSQGRSFLVFDEHLWELSPWLPGEAYHRGPPNPAMQLAAMRCLARFHQAAQSHPGATTGPAPGLLSRRETLRELRAGGLQNLRQAVLAKPASEWGAIAGKLLGEIKRALPTVLRRLESSADVVLPLQWCLRDVKRDHVLFEGERVSGLIDFGATAIDSVAGDIARLAGSLAGDARDQWPPLIDAYHLCRPLSAEERRVIELFDAGGTLAAASNWLRWLLIDGREFPHVRAVQNQLEGLHARLREQN